MLLTLVKYNKADPHFYKKNANGGAESTGKIIINKTTDYGHVLKTILSDPDFVENSFFKIMTQQHDDDCYISYSIGGDFYYKTDELKQNATDAESYRGILSLLKIC